jgi:hypothetical protein
MGGAKCGQHKRSNRDQEKTRARKTVLPMAISFGPDQHHKVIKDARDALSE